MSEHQNNIKVEAGTEKNFGVVFAIVFLIIGLYPLLNSQALRIWALIVAGTLIAVAFFSPKILTIPNRLWFKFGIALGSVIAPIVMAIVFFVTVVPTGLVFRLLGKDLLKQKLDKNAKSYWVARDIPVRTMKDQF